MSPVEPGAAQGVPAQAGIPGDIRAFLLFIRVPLVAVSLLVISEWLYFVTKTSFMSWLPYTGKQLAGLGALALALGGTLAALGLVLSLFPGSRLFRWLVAATGAFFATCLAALLVDNFTYTLFRRGVRSIESAWVSGALVALLVVVYVAMYRACLRATGPTPNFSARTRMGALVLMLLAGWLLWQPFGSWRAVPAASGGARPNVLIIGMDGLEAGHMSVLGYGRRTTPFLELRRDEFLMSAFNFTNSSASFGSIGALLTGKHPATTRLVYPPDLLVAEHQFEHLPGLLKDRDYRTLDMSLRWFTDARDMNMRCSFDEANFRTAGDCGNLSPVLRNALINHSAAFLVLEMAWDRIAQRLDLLNPWVENPTLDKDISRVGQPEHYWRRDDERIAVALEFMGRQDERPFFVNLHLMGMHGGRPMLEERHYSRGKGFLEPWDDDGYDDALLRFDRQAGEMIMALERLDRLDSTIVVITSDHGRKNSTGARLPLLIRFPEGRHAGILTGNTQRLDIAPTILGFMGEAIPDWMEGDNLVGDTVPDLLERPIFQVSPESRAARHRGGRIMQEFLLPPFYSIGRLHIISCDRQFTWILRNNIWKFETVGNRPAACDGKTLTRPAEYFALAREHLGSRGFDVSGMVNPVRIPEQNQGPETQ